MLKLHTITEIIKMRGTISMALSLVKAEKKQKTPPSVKRGGAR
jgi:hypothetical protein